MNAKLLIFGGEGLREWGRMGQWAFKGDRVPGASLSRSGLDSPSAEAFPSFGWGLRDGEVFAILRRLLAPHHGGYPQTLLIAPGQAGLRPFRNNPARFLKALLQADGTTLAPSNLDGLLDTQALQVFLADLQDPAEPVVPPDPLLTEWLLAALLDRPADPWPLRLGGSRLDLLDRLIPTLDALPTAWRLRASWLLGAPVHLGDEYGVRLVLQSATPEAAPTAPPGATGRLAMEVLQAVQPTWLWSGEPGAAAAEVGVEGLLRLLARGPESGEAVLLDRVRALPDRDHPEVCACERWLAGRLPQWAADLLEDHSPAQISDAWRTLVGPEAWLRFWSGHAEEVGSLAFPDWEAIWQRKLSQAPAERVPGLVARMLEHHPGVPDWLWTRALLRLEACPQLWREGADLLPPQAIKSLVRSSRQAQDEGLGLRFRLLLGQESDWDDLPAAAAECRCGDLLALVGAPEVVFRALAISQLDRLAGSLARESLPLALKRRIAPLAGGAWEPFRALAAAMDGRPGSELLEEPSLEESRRLVQELAAWPGTVGEARPPAPNLAVLENLLGAFAEDSLRRLLEARPDAWGLNCPGPWLATLFRVGPPDLPHRLLREGLRSGDALAQLPQVFGHVAAGILPRPLVLQEAEALLGAGAPVGCLLLAVLSGWPVAELSCSETHRKSCLRVLATAAEPDSPLVAWVRPVLEAVGPVPFAEFVTPELKADLLSRAPSWRPLATLERLADGSWTEADRQTELPLPVDFLKDWAHRSWSPQSRPLQGPPCLERLAGLWAPAQIAALPPPPVDLQRFPPWLRGLLAAGLQDRFESELGRFLDALAAGGPPDHPGLTGALLSGAQSLFQRRLGAEFRWVGLLPFFGPFEGWQEALQSPGHLAGLGLLARVHTPSTAAWLEVLAGSSLRRQLTPEQLSVFASMHPAWSSWEVLQRALAGAGATPELVPFPGEITRLLSLTQIPIRAVPCLAEECSDPEDRQSLSLLGWLLDGEAATVFPQTLAGAFLRRVLTSLLQRLAGLGPELRLGKYTQLLRAVAQRKDLEALREVWDTLVEGALTLGPRAGWRCLLVHPEPGRAVQQLRQAGVTLPAAALLRIQIHRRAARGLGLTPATPGFWRLLAPLGASRSGPGGG